MPRVFARPHLARTCFALALAVSAVVLFAPGDEVPEGVAFSDKLVHAALFGALAATGRLARVPLVPLAVGLVAFAGLSEWLQDVLPIDRDGDRWDLLADLVGVALGLLAARTRSARRT